MKNLLITAALLLGSCAYAQEAPAQAAQAAAQPARLDPALERTGRNLAILAEKYAEIPAELAPDSISAVPELHLPGHERTAVIKIVDSRKYDKDISKAVTGSGGWLYFSNSDSTYYGLLLLDSANPGPDGMKFFEY